MLRVSADTPPAPLGVQIHFAEEWNELHHLQIMESLGGDQFWVDRFMAQHAAVFYYWVIVGFFAFSPQTAYIFSELVEVRCYLCGAALDFLAYRLWLAELHMGLDKAVL